MDWDCYDNPKGDPYKNFTRGGVEVEDFDEEPRARHPKRKTKKARARSLTRTPCPETEDGKHVYVIAGAISEWRDDDKIFFDHFGYYRREVKTCCGCGQTSGYPRESERYLKVKERKWRKATGGEFNVKRGEPVDRYSRWGAGRFYGFCWEMEVPEYAAKIRAADAKRQAYWQRMRDLGKR